MSLPGIGLLLICTFLFSMSVYIALVYWRASSLQSNGVLDTFRDRWWNQRTVVYVFLALWVLLYIFPTGYFLIYTIITRADPIATLADIIEANREEYRLRWSIWNVVAAVTGPAVLIRFVLSRIITSTIILNWCAKNYGAVLAIMGAAAFIVSWIW